MLDAANLFEFEHLETMRLRDGSFYCIEGHRLTFLALAM